jgi:hypothetical protein
VEYSLYIISGIVKAIEVARGWRRSVKLGIIKLSSLSFKLEGRLYQASSLSLVALSNSSELEELRGEESSNWLSNKLGKLYKLLKVAIINKKYK